MPSASQDIIDLDEVVVPDITILLGGQRYKVPGDPPLEWLLASRQLAEGLDDLDELAIIERVRDHFVALLKVRQPALTDRDAAKALTGKGPRDIMTLSRRIYAAEHEEAVDPPRPASRASKAGTRSTKPRTPRSRSGS